MVSGTFVFSSPPATSPATDTGECWLRRRDSRPHVLQNAGAQDPTPPPTIAPRTRSLSQVTEVLPGCSLIVRMPSRPWPASTMAKVIKPPTSLLK